MTVGRQTQLDLLTRLLRDVSRSFYLTLRVLPAAVRPQIGLAYLLARTSDTIADTELLPLEQRLKALGTFRERMLDRNLAPPDFGELARCQTSPAERQLLEQCGESLARLRTLAPDDLRLVRQVLDTVTSGQELDLRRFAPLESTLQRGGGKPKPARQPVVALQNDTELDDYTYRVAGCVGEFWTKLCRAHLFPQAKLDEVQLLADGVRLGKGLQLVNILRDLPADLCKGRCYLPADRLAVGGLQPADLLLPENEPKLRPLYREYLDRALAHLAAGWAYTNALPRGQVRVRLACAWPILMGVRTLQRLRTASVLDPRRRVKISRREVRGILCRSVLRYPWRAAWERQFAEARDARGKAVASRGDLA